MNPEIRACVENCGGCGSRDGVMAVGCGSKGWCSVVYGGPEMVAIIDKIIWSGLEEVVGVLSTGIFVWNMSMVVDKTDGLNER